MGVWPSGRWRSPAKGVDLERGLVGSNPTAPANLLCEVKMDNKFDYNYQETKYIANAALYFGDDV